MFNRDSFHRDVVQKLVTPVIAAPMFLISGPDLVVATCRAGAIGAFPAPNCRTPGQLDQWLTEIRTRLDEARAQGESPAPWALNLITHSSNERLSADIEILAKHKPPIVITALGSPAPVIAAVHAYGGIVVADVVSIALARKAVAAGADGLACVSAGAGGHTGHLSPFAFVSGVREFFSGLVIIGGGIGDGWGVAGAIAAGADLVYVGTRFLATEESMAPRAYKEMVVEHGADDLVVTAAITGANASWLRPSLEANGIDISNAHPAGHAPNYNAAGNVQGRWRDIWAAGQGIEIIDAVTPTAAVVETLSAEYRAASERLFARTAGAQSR
ncbi:NAD(P)H-dependent flavin oxidoreductase [Leucobacter aridicollis]|uniref:NAD(P)H-dependent flavin oxidoreductase n=1 Tax=Leucobacter aridicollis TaxID=283878 RepID=UPI00210277B4|nr:nitronate monooxygenase [Leucobacter aridicollis]UTX54241.1 nitronate monooxygenase [Leucobacter aridicollis]